MPAKSVNEKLRLYPDARGWSNAELWHQHEGCTVTRGTAICGLISLNLFVCTTLARSDGVCEEGSRRLEKVPFAFAGSVIISTAGPGQQPGQQDDMDSHTRPNGAGQITKSLATWLRGAGFRVTRPAGVARHAEANAGRRDGLPSRGRARSVVLVVSNSACQALASSSPRPIVRAICIDTHCGASQQAWVSRLIAASVGPMYSALISFCGLEIIAHN